MNENGNGNGSDYQPTFHNGNGNGQGKIFSLKPATDPDTLAILDARRRVLGEQRLNRSMKSFFCEILDRSLNHTCKGYICKGVVAASDWTLARLFMVSARSVYNWKYGVARLGYFWLSKKFCTNMEPITVYNITALHPPREQDLQDDDGVSQSGPLRYGWSIGQGARTPGQSGLPLPGSRKGRPGAKNANLQGFSGENRKKLPFSTENNFGSQPKTVSDDNRKPFRFSTENNFGSQPKTVSDESRKQLPVSTEADCRLRRDSEGVLEPLEVHTHIADKKEALMPEFEPLDRKCAPRLRPKIAEEMIEYCKGKILAVETARTPQPMAKEQISAYRARIKAVKAWSAGAL